MFLQANTRMLEDGYYKSSLALHPIRSAASINDNELMQYLRSKTEVLHTVTSHAIFFLSKLTVCVSVYGYNIAPSSYKKHFFCNLRGA
jgi:hypothetical protein